MLNILLANYQYGSTAEHQNADGLSKVTRRYNSYHLLISETIVRKGKKYVSETEYYAKAGVNFNNQHTQYALPKKRTESWSELSEQCVTSSRTMVTHYQFDELEILFTRKRRTGRLVNIPIILQQEKEVTVRQTRMGLPGI
ncbi:hypothetical protein [Wolbachia endosymbiont (group B) of Camptogramma bilineatum]|uniref:hypothetical protein n=1 Tax=Wolbachia endosymbiont (group B) of Camptogramma bilineatum TaxID=2953991 RepID=UPI00223133F8|nr:hypothetical protein [Wolbachia endosymbiont (group B) of Camptogramma bilineatum]